ncbi:LysR family transcriptional regulator [Acidovorax sp. CCYZU-2555]|uniref:LysR family transcriptional regulator n=1 Tax=Acidovorax sp. CCYZU-2555 TaxID=2835042 RepID=UPI001BCD35B4|nr:LysR family transcriptional regulator [Acidovorax sp. CCYZU-2555]MBS7780950.1 LysR family transcriptional regulator [Acidovorax sp. CCYZU-2555]
MDLRQLKYFVAVARERNFTRAAEQLHMAQPPLGRQIQLLEEELGVPLLLRNSRPLRLTEAGRFLFEQAVQVLSRVEQMTAETRRLGLNQQGTLSIGFVPSTLYGGVPILLRKLRQQHPKLDIRLVELSSIQQVEALRTGRIDLGFGRIPSNDRAVTRIVLREERLVLAMPSTSPGAAKPQPMWLSELAEQKLIVYPKNPRPSFADQILALINGCGVQPAEIIEVNELQTALGLVASEAGVCIIPASATFRADLRYRPIADANATSPIIMCHRLNDDGWYIASVKKLVDELYHSAPSALGMGFPQFPGPMG